MRGEFVDVGGVRLYYYASGTRGSGDPIVLVHGFATSIHLWRDLIPLLPPGRRIVAADLLGHGRSDRPHNLPLSVSAHAERLRGLLGELRIDRAAFVGHDLGAAIAHRFSLTWPALTAAVYLVDPPAEKHWAASAAATTTPLLGGVGRAYTRGTIRARMMSGYVNRDAGAKSCARYLKPFGDAPGAAVLGRHIRALRAEQLFANGITPRSVERSGEVRPSIPTMIVRGSRDSLVRASAAQQLTGSLPGATMHVLDGIGHFAPEEAPMRLSQVLATLLL